DGHLPARLAIRTLQHEVHRASRCKAARIAGGQAGRQDGRGRGGEEIVQTEELRESAAAARSRRGGVILDNNAIAAVRGDGKLAVLERRRTVAAERAVQRRHETADITAEADGATAID